MSAEKPIELQEKPGLNLSREKRKAVIERISREVRYRVGGEAGCPLQPNEEVTKRLQKEEKYVKFNEWCRKHGVKSDAIEYPVAFGEQGELVGVRAKRFIGMCESFVYVPVRITINIENFKRSWVGEVYQDNIDHFEEQTPQAALVFFVAYQMTLGAKSFWYPYFCIAADSDLPMHWTDEELSLLEDNVLKM